MSLCVVCNWSGKNCNFLVFQHRDKRKYVKLYNSLNCFPLQLCIESRLPWNGCQTNEISSLFHLINNLSFVCIALTDPILFDKVWYLLFLLTSFFLVRTWNVYSRTLVVLIFSVFHLRYKTFTFYLSIFIIVIYLLKENETLSFNVIVFIKS